MNDVDGVIKRWGRAHRLAAENPALLLRSSSRRNTNIAVQRMADLSVATDALVATDGQPDLPEALVEWHVRRKLRPCYQCQFRSNTNDLHPACYWRGFRFWQAQEALAAYALALEEG